MLAKGEWLRLKTARGCKEPNRSSRECQVLRATGLSDKIANVRVWAVMLSQAHPRDNIDFCQRL